MLHKFEISISLKQKVKGKRKKEIPSGTHSCHADKKSCKLNFPAGRNKASAKNLQTSNSINLYNIKPETSVTFINTT